MLKLERKEGSGARLGRWGAAGITLLVLVAASVWSAGAARANHVQVGDVITILIRADAPQPVVSGAEIMFLGGPKLVTDVSGCFGGEQRPVQRIQIRNLGAQPSEPVQAIVVEPSEPIEPGTRAGTGTLDSTCVIGSTPYIKYAFTITK